MAMTRRPTDRRTNAGRVRTSGRTEGTTGRRRLDERPAGEGGGTAEEMRRRRMEERRTPPAPGPERRMPPRRAPGGPAPGPTLPRRPPGPTRFPEGEETGV